MNFDRILVVDIESTCWEERQTYDISEIIEIGISPIETKSGEVLGSRSIIVKPEHSEVSEFCTRLTTLTQEDVDSGISFKDACDILVNEYNSKKYVWCSYGYYDKNQFWQQCEREGVEYPFSKAHINAKILFALKYSLRKDVGMKKALKLLNMPLIGTHHRGIDDSKNVANILSKILFNKENTTGGNNEIHDRISKSIIISKTKRIWPDQIKN
jgi:inhibitor of KinA sporulation pathway (predicted exonuclease)